MTGIGLPSLDRDRIRELFDLRKTAIGLNNGGDYTEDPHPIWHELRESGPVHPGTVHGLCGIDQPYMFHGLPEEGRPHFSVFSYAACDEAYRHPDVFASSPGAGPEGEVSHENSMLMMGGVQHRRYRALVQPSFVPARATWWNTNWIEHTVHGLIDSLVDDGRAELNVDFCAAIPVLTITGSFGIPIEMALEVRAAMRDPMKVVEILGPIVAARREEPQDDLISVLARAEITDEDGTHQLSDVDIYSFSILLLMAGSGTTWKQMGITLAALLQRPDDLAAVRENRDLLRNAIEESVRWEPTDPMFSRWITEDIEFHGAQLPKGSVVHLCIGSGNRDPERWERADEYDIRRPAKPTLGFGGGPHVCLGMHVARAEMFTGISALLDRLPNLRLDPDASPPHPVGFYERGVMEIPVVWG